MTRDAILYEYVRHIESKKVTFENNVRHIEDEKSTLEKVEVGPVKFHSFGVAHKCYEDSTGVFSTAIVELENGTLTNVPVELVKFVKPGVEPTSVTVCVECKKEVELGTGFRIVVYNNNKEKLEYKRPVCKTCYTDWKENIL